MYSALWRLLPGPRWVRATLLLVLAALVLTALVLWVFPVIDQLTSPQDVTVEE
jgi:hypothetical protein